MTLLKDPSHKGFLAKLHLDGPLFAGLLALCCTGLFVLYSASGQHWDMMAAHSTRLLIAFGAMLLLAQVKPQQQIQLNNLFNYL